MLDLLAALRDVCNLYGLPYPIHSVHIQCVVPSSGAQAIGEQLTTAVREQLEPIAGDDNLLKPEENGA